MSNIFGNMSTEGMEEQGDRLGGYQLFDSGLYKGTVKLAYTGKAQASDAQNVSIVLDIDGQEYRETIYVTNRQGQNYYERDGKKNVLPGYQQIDSLALLTTGYPLNSDQQTFEEKVAKIYDFEAKKELPKNVNAITSIMGKEIAVGILRQIVDKNEKNAAGEYVPSGETREENTVDKFFHAESLRTVTEIKEKMEEAVFVEKWVEKNKGETRNRAKGANGNAGKNGAPGGAPQGGGQAAKPKTSLFGS